MAGGGSPRQKMINMMYLVLTALLALNVSKEILEAFVVVNEGMLIQKINIERNNGRIYGDFEQQKALYEKNYDKIKPYYEKAQRLKKMSLDLVTDIDVMKAELIAQAEGFSKEEVLSKNMSAKDLTKLEDYDIPTYYFGTDDPAKVQSGQGKASELKKKIAEFRDLLLSKEFLDKPSDTSKIRLNLSTDPVIHFKTKEEKTWEEFYFYHLPMPAALTELTKWQNNVRGAEGSVLSYLYDKIGASSYKFDAIKAAIIPKSNVVFAGNNFEADIFLAAYNTSEKPTIVANGATVTEFIDGRGIYKVQASGEGEKTVTGVIKIIDPITGAEKEEPFETKYQVAKPMMQVTPDQMNVFYRGLDNPITVGVPGVAPTQITANCTGCKSFKPSGGGKYIVQPGEGKEASISVSIKKTDGTTQNMGAAKFRVKRIPDPTIKFSNKKNNDVMSIVEATSGGALIPMLEDFDFNVYAVIRGFTVSFDPGTGSIYEKVCSGNQIPDETARMMKKIPKGKKLYFDNIKVNMPDGTVRTSSAVYTIR